MDAIRRLVMVVAEFEYTPWIKNNCVFGGSGSLVIRRLEESMVSAKKLLNDYLLEKLFK